MITIIDSGGANISSIQFALARLGSIAQLSSDPDVINQSSHLILPGVGSAQHAMQYLTTQALIPVIRQLTQPVLGICLGMQLLFEHSAEGNVPCLGLIPEKVEKISSADKQLIVPHMGWNKLTIVNPEPLFTNLPDDAYVYFVHSYFAALGAFTTTTTFYGETFSASVQKDNFYGVQFHPERSGRVGSMILKNFLEL